MPSIRTMPLGSFSSHLLQAFLKRCTKTTRRQTVDTFQAAATFFDLLNMSIWAPADPEMAAKSKYAKYHAVRIVKAIKAGEDPNASNPVAEEAAPQSPVAGLENDAPPGDAYLPPTVESAPESRLTSRPGSVAQPSPFVPPSSATPLAPGAPYQDARDSDDADRSASVGGGYFPSVPTFTSDTAQPKAPTANPVSKSSGESALAFIDRPDAPSTVSATDFYSQSQAPPHVPAPIPRAAPVQSIPQAAPLPPVQALAPGSYRTDDDSIALATKHAKWAISALNFEDVNTAVKEFRLALQTLGAQ